MTQQGSGHGQFKDEDVSTTPLRPQTQQSDSGGAGSSSAKLGFALVALLIVAGIGGYFAWRGKLDEKPLPVPIPIACATPDCGFTEVRALQLDEVLPVRCPKCGKQSLYCTRKCQNCGTGFILNEDLGLPGPTKCPKCATEFHHGE